MVRLKSETLTFLAPLKYIEKIEKVLSIELDHDIVLHFIEIKASRDIIVHNAGKINSAYLRKSGDKARGKLGENLNIDEDYFKDVIVTAKSLSGKIMHQVEKKFG